MKLLSFTILMLFSYPSYAIEFYHCIDDKGKSHFTNLPKSSLDSNCAVKDRYALMLNQDYQNMASEHEKYNVTVVELDEESEDEFKLTQMDLSVDSVTQSVKDIFDPDKAFDQLMQTTEDRDDVFTRAMRGRSNAIDEVMEANTPQ